MASNSTGHPKRILSLPTGICNFDRKGGAGILQNLVKISIEGLNLVQLEGKLFAINPNISFYGATVGRLVGITRSNFRYLKIVQDKLRAELKEGIEKNIFNVLAEKVDDFQIKMELILVDQNDITHTGIEAAACKGICEGFFNIFDQIQESKILKENNISTYICAILIGLSPAFGVIFNFLVKTDQAYRTQTELFTSRLINLLEKYKTFCIAERIAFIKRERIWQYWKFVYRVRDDWEDWWMEETVNNGDLCKYEGQVREGFEKKFEKFISKIRSIQSNVQPMKHVAQPVQLVKSESVENNPLEYGKEKHLGLIIYYLIIWVLANIPFHVAEMLEKNSIKWSDLGLILFFWILSLLIPWSIFLDVNDLNLEGFPRKIIFVCKYSTFGFIWLAMAFREYKSNSKHPQALELFVDSIKQLIIFLGCQLCLASFLDEKTARSFIPYMNWIYLFGRIFYTLGNANIRGF